MLVLPLLQNCKNEQWNADIVIRSISTEDQRRCLIGSLLRVIRTEQIRRSHHRHRGSSSLGSRCAFHLYDRVCTTNFSRAA